MGSAPLLRLLSLALLLLPAPFRDYLPLPSSSNKAKHHHAVGDQKLRPIILLPGVSCSNLEARLTDEYRPSVPRCGAMKGKGWFGLWENSSDLVAHDYAPCFEEQMRLVYDPAIGDYRNLPGVETRVPGFGSTRGFQHKDPRKPGLCLTKLRDTLETMGYRDGETLFGAPYDFRHAPPAPGQPSEVYSRYFARLRKLVEDVVVVSSRRRRNNYGTTNSNNKVILLGHSYGGMVALEFVRSTPLPWREKHIKHLFLAAPTLFEGFVAPLQNLVSGPHMFHVPNATDLSLRPMWWTWETALMFLPTAPVYGRRPLVTTDARNYSAYDVEDLLLAIGFRDLRAFRTRAVPHMRQQEKGNLAPPPMVPVTCFNGAGVPTPSRLVYRRQGNFDSPPDVVHGDDGDGMINSIAMSAFDRSMRRHPGQRRMYRSIRIDKAHHETLLTDDSALQRVIPEIIQANNRS